jgi:trimeric autotransporter adhesin
MARDDDKAMDGLLRRSLARDTGAAGDCPDADILAAYYERSLDPDEAAAYELHIARCAHCREQLAEMVRVGREAEAPAEQLLAAAAPSAPRAKAVGSVTVPTPGKPARSWAFDWRWLAPAAAVIIFAAIVYVRIAPREAIPLLSKEVAVSKPETAPPPVPSQELSAPAARLQAPHESPANPPAAVKSNAAAPTSPVPRELAAPPPPSADKSAPTPARPNSRALVPAMPQARSSQFVGGAMARGSASGMRTSLAGHTASAAASAKSAGQQPAAATPAASESPNTEAQEQQGSALTQAAPPQAEAKEESQVADSSAQTAQSTAANDQKQAPAAAGGSAGGAINSMTQAVQVTASTASVTVSEKIGALYRVTPDGSVERSADGGATWRLERLKTKAPIVAVSAPSGEICWLVGRGGTILLTKNAKSWKKVLPPVAIDLTGVTAQDARSAIVTTIDGREFSTTDGGKTWQQVK